MSKSNSTLTSFFCLLSICLKNRNYNQSSNRKGISIISVCHNQHPWPSSSQKIYQSMNQHKAKKQTILKMQFIKICTSIFCRKFYKLITKSSEANNYFYFSTFTTNIFYFHLTPILKLRKNQKHFEYSPCAIQQITTDNYQQKILRKSLKNYYSFQQKPFQTLEIQMTTILCQCSNKCSLIQNKFGCYWTRIPEKNSLIILEHDVSSFQRFT